MLGFPKTVYIESICNNNQLNNQCISQLLNTIIMLLLLESYFYFRIILEYIFNLLLYVVTDFIVTEIQCGECLYEVVSE